MLDRNKISEFLQMETSDSRMMQSPSFAPNDGFISKMIEFHNETIPSIELALRNRNWQEVMTYFPRRANIIVFLYIRHHLNDEEYFRMLGWIINDIYMQDYEDLVLYLLKDRDAKYIKHMMTIEERKTFEELQTNTIFRGLLCPCFIS